MLARAHIFVRGLVQGVGFRPFIYTIATDNQLSGFVLNLGDAGVEIIAEGNDDDLKKFIEEIRTKKPGVARVDVVEVEFGEFSGKFKGFKIEESKEQKFTVRSVIPTDLSICDNCITDIYNESRWRNYPFTACAQCGPRFTVINRLPYDRKNTSMDAFPFCDSCQAEYDNPKDRRYDAQGITCPICGPQIWLVDNNYNRMNCEPLSETAKLLHEGCIVAVKGIGGFHIAVDAANESSVKALRKRRIRPFQPFAVMSRTLEKIKKFALISNREQEFLTNIFHPIVLLQKSENYSLAESVSPALDSIGVMLPYTGIHLLLLDHFKGDALVMTSGNYPGKPIFISNDQALNELKNIVDYFLIHNRTIVNRCDDSVIKIVEGHPLFLRKSRGYAPSFLALPWRVGHEGIISVGGDFNVTGSIFLEDRLITTQHIGDAEEFETLEFLKNALNFIIKNYNLSHFSCIAHDLNPSFLTTRYAKELGEFYEARTFPVQHHHAHLAALLADNSMPKESEIVCIDIDGVGYGLDGMAWGGEILVGGYKQYERAGHLKYQPMPGGDLCTKYPARMLAAILSTAMSDSELTNMFKNSYNEYLKHGEDELQVIIKQSKIGDVLKTSSTGRLLDSIATLLKVCWNRTYEGEPPIRLETVAKKGQPSKVNLRLPLSRDASGAYILDTSDFILSIVENLDKKREDVAFEAHRILASALAEMACIIGDEKDIQTIGLTGGAAVNSILFRYIKKVINENNKQLVSHKDIPCGDGGISTGQAVAASFSSV